MQGNDEQFSQKKGSETHSESSKGPKAKPRRKSRPRTKNSLNLKKRIADGTLYSQYAINGRIVELTKTEKYSNVDNSLIFKVLSNLRRDNSDFEKYFEPNCLNKKRPYLIFNDSYQITKDTNPIEILKQLATPQKKPRLNFSAMLHSDDKIVSIELVEDEEPKKALLFFKPPYDSVEYITSFTRILYEKIFRNNRTIGTYFETPSQRQDDIKLGMVCLVIKKDCGLNSSEDVMAKLREFWPTKISRKKREKLFDQIEDVEFDEIRMIAKLKIKGATEENSSKVYRSFNSGLFQHYRYKKDKFTQFFDMPHETSGYSILNLKSTELCTKDKFMSALKDVINSPREVISKKRSAKTSRTDKNVPAPKRRHLEQLEEDEDSLNTMLSISLPLPTINSGIPSSPMQASEPSISPILHQFQNIEKLNAFQAPVQDPEQAAPATGLDKIKIGYLLNNL